MGKRLRISEDMACLPDDLAGRRAAVFLNYVLRPAGFIGHCNVRSSLNVAGTFRSSKKHRLCFGLLMTSMVGGSSPVHHA
jgi:hypothetical protein